MITYETDEAGCFTAYEVVWPKMLQEEGEALALIKTSWRQGSVRYPYLLHCQVMAAAGAAMTFCRDDEATYQYLVHKRLEHRMVATKLIRKELQHMSDSKAEPPEELILAILNLVTSSGDVDESIDEDPNVHPQSPLASEFPKEAILYCQVIEAAVFQI